MNFSSHHDPSVVHSLCNKYFRNDELWCKSSWWISSYFYSKSLFIQITRKHSSRMSTARLPNVQWGSSWTILNMSGEGSLYGEVQCIIGDGHMGPPRAHTDWHTDWKRYMAKTITFPKLHWRAVTIRARNLLRHDSIIITSIAKQQIAMPFAFICSLKLCFKFLSYSTNASAKATAKTKLAVMVHINARNIKDDVCVDV